MPGDPAPHPIRRLAPDDAAMVRALRLEALAAAPEAFGASAEEEGAQPLPWFAERLVSDAVFGAFANMALCGMVGLHIEAAAKRRHIGHVWGVYLRQDQRGQGLGPALLRAVLDHAAQAVTQVQLGVAVANAPALRLYRRAGFRIYGTEPAALRVGGRDVDEHLMVLDLRTRPSALQ